MFSEESKVPRALFEARKVAGSATYKQLHFKVTVYPGGGYLLGNNWSHSLFICKASLILY